ncbi:hypothetical protein BDC45DRAFT_540485 [Circinella umbellata]|nr:hypothetical protein BDC45DRAFT_540485 [Circinella umbellata]
MFPLQLASSISLTTAQRVNLHVIQGSTLVGNCKMVSILKECGQTSLVSSHDQKYQSKRKFRRACLLRRDALKALRKVGIEEDDEERLQNLQNVWDQQIRNTLVSITNWSGRFSASNRAIENFRVVIAIFDLINNAFRVQGNGFEEYDNANTVLSKQSHFRFQMNITNLLTGNKPYDAFHGLQRANEELIILKDEATSVIKYADTLTKQLQDILQAPIGPYSLKEYYKRKGGLLMLARKLHRQPLEQLLVICSTELANLFSQLHHTAVYVNIRLKRFTASSFGLAKKTSLVSHMARTFPHSSAALRYPLIDYHKCKS